MALTIATQRIKREMKEIHKDLEVARCGIKVLMNEANLLELTGEIAGPENTPYAGGTYKLEICIPDSYPFFPPKIKFLTKIWHPNISSVTGAVCIDILKEQWAAAMTIRTVLLSLQSLLSTPEPDDPQDAVVASQFKNHHALYIKTAQHWTAVYAGGPNGESEYEDMVKELAVLGISEAAAMATLSRTNWNIQEATALSFT